MIAKSEKVTLMNGSYP